MQPMILHVAFDSFPCGASVVCFYVGMYVYLCVCMYDYLYVYMFCALIPFDCLCYLLEYFEHTLQ
jgi:hypothetical protein